MYASDYLEENALELALSNARYQFQDPLTLRLLFRTYDRAGRGRLSFENFLELAVTLAVCRKEYQQRVAAMGTPGYAISLNFSQVTDVVSAIVASSELPAASQQPPAASHAASHPSSRSHSLFHKRR